MGIRAFDKKLRGPIYAIYGFVRFADEIVDTFHEFDKDTLLQRFREETYRAIEERISLNPVLHSFQEVVHKYQIEPALLIHFWTQWQWIYTFQNTMTICINSIFMVRLKSSV